MHFQILVEDISGKEMLDVLVPKIIDKGSGNTFDVKAYKGVGRIPKGLKSASDAGKRILLDQLPRLLRGYGKTYNNYSAAVIVVCDLDDRCLKAFRRELLGLLDSCVPKPDTRFCVAIEEGEAWLLGDIPAIKKAYPSAKDNVLRSYKNDSVCGTWEYLADALMRGGAQSLKIKGYQIIGREKIIWARRITPYMNVDCNKSPSFAYFRETFLKLLNRHSESKKAKLERDIIK